MAKSSPTITLIDNKRFDDNLTTQISGAFNCQGYSKFILYLDIDSTSTPTDILFDLEFSDTKGGTYYKYMNAFWGDLRYEDSAVASGIKECVVGDLGGDWGQLKVTVTGNTSTKYFDVTAKIRFFN